MSSLSFGVISRKVGQSPGSCLLVQPNTGHCRGSSCTGPCSPLAADVTPPLSAAVLAALLAALPLLFPLGVAVAVTFGGSPLGCCAVGVSELFSAAAPPELGVVGRVALLADGSSPGSVESVR